MQIPPFHPEWLVKFWLTTPGLNKLNPHLVLLFTVGLVIGFSLYKKKRASSASPHDWEEERFQYLWQQKNLLEKKLEDLECERKLEKISQEQYAKKKQELNRHLERTNRELRQFT